jgi:DNA helicase-2/ATP-dependent DNA helicase PcrA
MTAQYTARILAEMLHAGPGPVLYPTDDQAGIIEAPLEPLLVVAGAGSGKTKTMADRVVWLVANGQVRPEEILGVTFTRKAAGELAARIRQQLAALYRVLGSGCASEDRLEPAVSTYHSYANGIVQDYGLRLGVERDSVMLGTAQAWQLAHSLVERYQGAWEHLPAKSTLVKAVLDMASECAEHLVGPARVRSELLGHIAAVEDLARASGKQPGQTARNLLDKLRTRVTVTELVEEYAAAKHVRRQLDYGDLVALAARIAADIPEAAGMERSKYRVVLLDEFQDTSHAQMVLFSELFGDGRAVTAVGDPHQSIYGFRGASAGQLGTFRNMFPRINATGRRSLAPVAHLSVAWRNSTSILEAANAVAAPLNVPAPWSRSHRLDVPGLQPRPAATPGEVHLGRFLCDATVTDASGPVPGEAAALADHLVSLRRRVIERDTAGRPLVPTTAVLCRGRRQFEPIRRELEQRGVEVQVVGLGGLLSTPEIVELLAVLRVLGDPDRSDAMLRVLAGARWQLGPADLMTLGDWSRQLARARERAGEGVAEDLFEQDSVEAGSLVEAVDHLPPAGWSSAAGRSLSDEGRTRLGALRDELRYLRGFVGDDLGSLINEVERRILLDVEVAAKPLTGIHQARRNLDAFADAAADFSASADRVDLGAFLAWLDAARQEEDGLPVSQLDASREAVQLLTVHAAKGLEWDIVAVPGLNERSFPSNRDSRWSSGSSAIPWPMRGDAAELPQWDWEQPELKLWVDSEKEYAAQAQAHAEREERRLAYVAFTRAKHVLVCTSTHWGSGRSRPTAASPYLMQLKELSDAGAPGFSELLWITDAEQGTANPANLEQERALWPADPLGKRRAGLEAAAAAVRAACRQYPLTRAGTGPDTEALPDTAELPDTGHKPPGRWTHEVQLALARHSRRSDRLQVELPAHISASLLVELSEDPQAVARQLRRPLPRRPAMAARKGTAFHAWVEDFYGTTGMLDLGEYPGAADGHVDESLDLEEMMATFRASPWAQRTPAEIEVPVETRVGGVVVRGRIDAVFRDESGGWELVDWKTGAPPSPGKLALRSVQLAVYRLAWSRLKDVPLAEVRAAFYYVGSDRLVRPHDLAGEDELERIIRAATAPG